MNKHQTLDWSVGFTADPHVLPAEWVPAVVPGAVQLDWARAKAWGPFYYGNNCRDYRWMEDVYWVYRTKLTRPALKTDQRLFFVCKGIDYCFKVKLNDQVLHEQEGMFTPFELDLTKPAKDGDELSVIINPVPKSHASPDDHFQANQSCKPAVSYGWDFHPRLVPLGIWDETYLEVRPACHIRDAEVRYQLTPDFSAADISLDILLSQPGQGSLHWKLLDNSGKEVFKQEVPAGQAQCTLSARFDKPELWWPNGQGAPTLYTSIVELKDQSGTVLDRRECRVGFRQVRLVMYPGAWGEHKRHPMDQNHPPITLEINGRRIFTKGSNWVNPHIFPGAVTVDTYQPLLDLAQAAHMNLLRLWGGAIVNKEPFYNLCAERGLMLWQDFPLACNRYEGTPHYLRVLDQESRSIITRLRRHTAVVLWCGGNELFNSWSRMTEQDAPIRLLNRNTFDLDPSRPFIMTSPLSGMGHGNYIFRTDDGREIFQIFSAAVCTAYTEFGCGGPLASRELLNKIIPPAEQFPPQPDTAWETHHAFKAWIQDTHLPMKTMEHYFGPSASLDEVLERGALLQCEALKCLFEEARRQKPRAAMALNWCFNEPWLTAANCSIISWPAQPKPAYHAVTRSLRPALASVKIPKFQWKTGELLTIDLWLLNDAPDAVGPGRMEARLKLGSQEYFLLGWDFPGTAANTNLAGPVIRYQLPESDAARMEISLQVIGHPEMGSSYTLLYQKQVHYHGPRPAAMNVVTA